MNFSFCAHATCVLATALTLMTPDFSTNHFNSSTIRSNVAIHQREIFIPQPFTQVEIHGNVHIILTMEKTQSIIVEAEEKVADAVIMENIRGRMVIRTGQSYHYPTTNIYLPATTVTRLYFNGNGSLYSNGVIQHPTMSVILNGTVDVRVVSSSPLHLHTTDAYELED